MKAEPLTNGSFWQVVSYGTGGHYEPHVDFYGEYLDEVNRGDRISTILFYLNKVKSGGSTVFPFLGLSVQPIKGSALFWHNLRYLAALFRPFATENWIDEQV